MSPNPVIVNNRFSLQVPDLWVDKTVYVFEGPEENGIKHNIWVTVENDVDVPDLEQYAAINIRALESGLQGYQELKRGPLLLSNRSPAYEHVYRWSPAPNRTIFQRVMYVLKNRTGYVLTSSFSKKTWKMMGTEIDKMYRSFVPG